LVKLRIIVKEAIGLMRGHNVGWKAFWESNPDWSHFKVKFKLNGGKILLPYLAIMRAVPRLCIFTPAFALQLRKKNVEEKYPQ